MKYYRNAHIWTLKKKVRAEIHQELSNRRQQFTYLPLHILKSATNLGEVVLPRIAKGKKENVDPFIGLIHSQLATCNWPADLDDLSFVESIPSDDDEPMQNESNAHDGKTSKTTCERSAERDTQPGTSTAKPNSTKQVSKASVPQKTSSSRVRQSREVYFFISN